MRSGALAIFCLSALTLFAQTDRGTLTGTISDPAGAVVPNAPVQIKNIDTGSVYQGASSATGNYTIAQLPAGTYAVSVAAPGFKTYNRTNVTLPVSTTLRIDVTLEVGATSESVTVTEAAPLLKTESGELAHNVETSRLNNLPVLTTGAGSTGLRNVYSSLNTIPGAEYSTDNTVRVNGLPSNTQAMRIEGQDATTGLWRTQSLVQPSVDAVQEVSIQTSNFAAEFGQAGGGVINTTMRSGTNQWHGSAYDYLQNEALNSARPFVNAKTRQRSNDYGFSLGGPVRIPKVYNGTDKTFFFFNFEQFRRTTIDTTTVRTVPTDAYRNGDFSAALQRNLSRNPSGEIIPGNLDPLGREIFENAIYDPATDRIVTGTDGTQRRVRDPFPGNIIPSNRLDTVSLKVQSFIPKATALGSINNFNTPILNQRLSSVPSFKIDHNLSANLKLSGYFSRTTSSDPTNDGMPFPITSAIPAKSTANTYRVNVDYTVTPTALLHIGVGMLDFWNYQNVGEYDPAQIGFKGTNAPYFPSFRNLSGAQGGYSLTTGGGTNTDIRNLKPTGNISLTKVSGNHSYKFGGEFFTDGYVNQSLTYATPWIEFSPAQTSMPYLNGNPLNNGTTGFAYASFLLGAVNGGYFSTPGNTRLGKKALGFFAQDTWKVTRKLTLDYGLRYDYQTYLKEQYGRQGSVGPTTPNPSTGNLPGATIFEATCKCNFAKNYPYAFGPRLGVAYQINSKTVLRAGFGVSYTKTANNNFQSYAVAANTRYDVSAYGVPVYNVQDGINIPVQFPNFDPGQLPLYGTPAGTLNFFDQNAGRPGRILQWSIGLQRELSSNLVVEASYVGNRGAWFQAGNLVDSNAIDAARFAAFGIDPTSVASQTLLRTPLNQLPTTSPYYNSPYPTFPRTQTVFQAIRPFPMYTSMLRLWAPLGNSQYDALQTSITKRFSKGLSVNGNFTYGKQYSTGAESDVFFFQAVTPPVNNIFNHDSNKFLSGYDQRWNMVLSFTYTTPRITGNKFLRAIAGDWQLGGLGRWGQGLPLTIPNAQSGLATLNGRTTYAERVPGEPLFLKDLNGDFDPTKDFVLNPKAWKDPAVGAFGTTPAKLNDYRGQRRYTESFNFGRNFKLKQDSKYVLQIRAEFTNIFNRAFLPDPTSTNAGATQTCANAAGVSSAANCSGSYLRTSAGFGFINTLTAPPQGYGPRDGRIVARFSF